MRIKIRYWRWHKCKSMLTDEKSSLKVCKHCGNAFAAGRLNSVFCSGRCKNQYNVYKSRAKHKDNNYKFIGIKSQKEGFYEYGYCKTNGNGAVQNRR